MCILFSCGTLSNYEWAGAGEARSLMCLKCLRREEEQKDIILQYNDPWKEGGRGWGGVRKAARNAARNRRSRINGSWNCGWRINRVEWVLKSGGGGSIWTMLPRDRQLLQTASLHEYLTGSNVQCFHIQWLISSDPECKKPQSEGSGPRCDAVMVIVKQTQAGCTCSVGWTGGGRLEIQPPYPACPLPACVLVWTPSATRRLRCRAANVTTKKSRLERLRPLYSTSPLQL